MNREELAWAAGLFDGEGCTRTAQGPRRQYMKAWLTVSQNDRQVLDRFQAAVGVGKVYGPYAARGRKNPQYQFVVSDFPQVQAVVAMLWTWLSPVKRAQAKVALLSATRRVRKIAWLRCRNDHPLIGPNRYEKNGRVECRRCGAEKMAKWRKANYRRVVLQPAQRLIAALGVSDWT